MFHLNSFFNLSKLQKYLVPVTNPLSILRLQVSLRAMVRGVEPPVDQPRLSKVCKKYRIVFRKNSPPDFRDRKNPFATDSPKTWNPSGSKTPSKALENCSQFYQHATFNFCANILLPKNNSKEVEKSFPEHF